MHRLAYVALVLPACTSSPAAPPEPTTVHDQLAGDGALLAVTPAASTGVITARLWRTGWQDSPVELHIDAGELVVSTDASGAVTIEDLGFVLAPIELSTDVFEEPTRLVDLRAELAADAPPAQTTWTDANAATATTEVALRLSWSLEVGGRVTPLGPVVLSALPIELSVGGTPDHIESTLGLESTGTVWSWAGLIELADLSLSIAATSAAVD